MGKLKIEKGASRVRRAPLKVTIDGTVADDLELMCEWSENELSYLVNLLLGFAIAQSEDFQRYKAERSATPSPAHNPTRPLIDKARKVVSPPMAVSARPEEGASA
jgi:hypothetical protein